MSLDGYIDDASGRRLRLSDEADLDQVDDIRSGCDAILVGAGTIRADNPALQVRSPVLRDARKARGLGPDPTRVVLSRGGDLDPGARIFTVGIDRLVYVSTAASASARERLGGAAEVVDAGDPVQLEAVLADLAVRGIARLLVEGGRSLHTELLTSGLADELRLAVAPFFIGDSAAPRFVGNGDFPWNAAHRARLAEVTRTGDMAVLRYALSGRYDTAEVERHG
jgi:5-amino-6-(5-phosphoribosylamino)uracil reductase